MRLLQGEVQARHQPLLLSHQRPLLERHLLPQQGVGDKLLSLQVRLLLQVVQAGPLQYRLFQACWVQFGWWCASVWNGCKDTYIRLNTDEPINECNRGLSHMKQVGFVRSRSFSIWILSLIVIGIPMRPVLAQVNTGEIRLT
jgi:hypothetical protein